MRLHWASEIGVTDAARLGVGVGVGLGLGGVDEVCGAVLRLPDVLASAPAEHPVITSAMRASAAGAPQVSVRARPGDMAGDAAVLRVTASCLVKRYLLK
ncbi:hypothetical protein [Streptomyces sp. SAI-090]|jgi:hypothetical protein|uniref:hypothetical protein n=1 Tax=Streptomyces sp. SAI-090 TaxID=2940545 RepID=UPI0024743937|nr:hypothetical protein [Streptomyces sp. SAI-090]MDH6522286.1 hypothetical protein [Streptomyces sp. SAI-090]